MTEHSPQEKPAVAPAAIYAAPGADDGAETSEPEHCRIAVRRGPVVIVDDDDSVCDSLAMVLETYGLKVMAYPSGIEFLADERHRDLGFLIIDQHMPGMDGLDVLAALAREGVHAPAILITGRLDTTIAERVSRLQPVVQRHRCRVLRPVARLVAGGAVKRHRARHVDAGSPSDRCIGTIWGSLSWLEPPRLRSSRR